MNDHELFINIFFYTDMKMSVNFNDETAPGGKVEL